jgi:RNAse (barnase) inhibitor barstar
MTNDQIRLLVYRQIRLEHPEYTQAQLQRVVDEVVDLIQQVEEAKAYEESIRVLEHRDLS